MSRARKVFLAALALSLLTHLSMLGSAGRWWNLPAREVPFPIDATLVEAKPAPSRPKAPLPRPTAATPAPVEAPPAIASEPTPQDPPAPPTPEPTPPPVPVAEAAPAAPASPAPAETATPAPVELPKAVRQLPPKLILRYAVQYGEEGFNLGIATYTWLALGDRYILSSVAEATGLASLFMSGRIVQTSQGRITATGLQPEQFWISRNERKQEMAHFDWTQHRLVLPSGGVALPDLSQDLISFPFQLAVSVRETDSEWQMSVTNGRTFKAYTFRNLGAERIQALEREFDALHLQGSRPNEGTLDVWLSARMHWLPARIRTQDTKGKVIMLSLVGLEG